LAKNPGTSKAQAFSRAEGENSVWLGRTQGPVGDANIEKGKNYGARTNPNWSAQRGNQRKGIQGGAGIDCFWRKVGDFNLTVLVGENGAYRGRKKESLNGGG